MCYVTTDRLVPYAAHKIALIKNDASLTQYIYTQKDKSKKPTLGIIVSKFGYNNIQNVIVLDFSRKHFSDLNALSDILRYSIIKENDG